jgi:plasmid stability protein
MANLSVRNIEKSVYDQLKARAARHGVSMEEEVRRILRRSVAAPEKIGSLAMEHFGPAHGVELELPARDPHDPIELDG